MCRPPRGDASRKPRPDSDSGSLSSGTPSLPGAAAAAAPAPPPPPPLPAPASPDLLAPPNLPAAEEADPPSDEDDGFSEAAGRRSSTGGGGGESPTSAIEAQFLHLDLSEGAVPRCAPAPCVQPERVGDTPEAEPRLLRGHFSAIKRKPGSLRSTRTQSRSLDGPDHLPATASPDLNALLEREFSVQSLTSVINEDCFFDPAEGGTAAAAAHSGPGDASSCSSSS